MPFEVTWTNPLDGEQETLIFESMNDLIGHYLCGQCYRQFQEGMYPSIRKTPCGAGLGRIKEVD